MILDLWLLFDDKSKIMTDDLQAVDPGLLAGCRVSARGRSGHGARPVGEVSASQQLVNPDITVPRGLDHIVRQSGRRGAAPPIPARAG